MTQKFQITNGIFTGILIYGLCVLCACTIVRERDPRDGGGSAGTGGGIPQLQPKQVDLLVLTEIDPATANLANALDEIIRGAETVAMLRGVVFRKVALAPLYARVGSEVPLLYGRREPSSEDPLPGPSGPQGEGGAGIPFAPQPEMALGSLAAAMIYYAGDEGRAHLTDRVEMDGHNLAAVGANLGRYTVFVPEGGPADARPYFEEPVDGFVVIVFSGTRRYCGPTECLLDSSPQGQYFTRDQDGVAAWLSFLGDSGLPISKTVHIFVSTDEGAEADGFYQRCANLRGMPPGLIDILEPSPVAYFGPLADSINANGGRAQRISMCSALANPQRVSVDIASAISAAL